MCKQVWIKRHSFSSNPDISRRITQRFSSFCMYWAGSVGCHAAHNLYVAKTIPESLVVKSNKSHCHTSWVWKASFWGLVVKMVKWLRHQCVQAWWNQTCRFGCAVRHTVRGSMVKRSVRHLLRCDILSGNVPPVDTASMISEELPVSIWIHGSCLQISIPYS